MFGKQAIVDCYDDSGLSRFAIFKGKELVVAGDSVEELERVCDRLSLSGSAATYKLRLYEDNAEERIKPSTDYVCSYEVKFADPYQGNGVVGGWGNTFLGRIEKLEKQMQGGKEEKEDRLTDALYGLIEEPEKLVQAVGAFRALLGFASPTPLSQAAIAGVEQSSKIITPDDEAKVIKLSQALDKLEKRDPLIVNHMERLATIAETKPETFKMLLGMLDNF